MENSWKIHEKSWKNLALGPKKHGQLLNQPIPSVSPLSPG
jgi:hypothetical protein